MSSKLPGFTIRGGRPRDAFTLIEIMIVILVIGVILAIAVPTWLKSRNNAQTKVCLETQAQLEGAIDRWIFENNKTLGDDGPQWEEIVGPESMLKKTAMCPVGPTKYVIPKVGMPVVCPNVDRYPKHERK